MVHQMWEALFVTTFQNKDNLLIILKRFAKVHIKCRKILFLSFVLSFSYKLAKIHIERSFFIYPFIYLCCSLPRKKLYIVRTEKSSFYLPSLILSFFFQTRKKKNANLFISNYVYLKFSVF